MKSIRRDLKTFITEVVKASKGYMEKERVRQALQSMITEQVRSGKIKSQADLEDFFATCDMSLKALRMVPYDVFTKMS